MKDVKFWVGLCLEAGSESVAHRYFCGLELEDEEYELLYQMWLKNGRAIAGWKIDLQNGEEEELATKIDSVAYFYLLRMMHQHEPTAAPIEDMFWELSEETVKGFEEK